MPALAIMLLVVSGAIALIYAPFEQIELARTALLTATYRSNLYFANISLNYLNTSLDTNPLLHSWSLSVEEQFYFVWPLFMMLATGLFQGKRAQIDHRLNRSSLLLWLSVVTVLSFIYAVHLTAVHQPAAFFLSPPRAWEFSIGAIALLIPLQLNKRLRNLIGLLGLSSLFIAVASFDSLTPFPGWAALIPTLSTLLILKSGEPAHWPQSSTAGSTPAITQLLSTQPLQRIGKLSYSWYLWHWPVLIIASTLYTSLSLPVRIGLVLGSLIPAIASYHLIENPVRRSPKLSKKAVYTLLLAIAFTLSNAYLFSSWLQSAGRWSEQPNQIRYVEARNDHTTGYDNGCHVALLDTTPNLDPHCITGSPNSSTTAILFGDSHAAQWSDVMASIATAQDWQFTAMTKSACPYISTRTTQSSLARPYAECSQWRQKSIAAMRDLQPDWIFASTSAFAYDLSPEQWRQGTEQILSELSAIARHVVILRDTPSPSFEVPICLARQQWQPLKSVKHIFNHSIKSSCKTAVERDRDRAVYTAQVEAASEYSNVSFIDMLPYICEEQTCPVEQNGTIVYRDDNHLATRFTQTLSDELLSEINSIDDTNPARSALLSNRSIK